MLEVALGVIGGFVGAALVGSYRAHRAHRGLAGAPIDTPIALDLARHHRMRWAILTGASLIAFVVAASIPHLGESWIAGALVLTLAAGTTCVRADYMLCAIDHPDVTLAVRGGFLHGSVGATLVGWLRASPALIQQVAGKHLPAARLRG